MSTIELVRDIHATQLLAVLLGISILAAVLKSLYNVFFHPLRKFPGPKLAGASRMYLAYYECLGQKHTVLLSLHNTYGEVVRISPDQLSFINETAWKDIYSYRGKDRVQMEKGDGRGPPRKPPTNVVNSSDADHARQRKILSSSFSERALREQEPLLQTYIDQLISVLKAHAEKGQPVDMTLYFELTTSDIISDFCFTESYGQLKTGKQEPVLKALHKFIPVQVKLRILPRPLQFLFILRFLGITEMALLAKSQEQVRTRLERRVEEKDVMKQVMQHLSDDGQGISLEELGSNAMVLMLAGSETTATSLAGTMFYLLKNPDVQAKLLEEIRTQFQTSHEITIAKASQLPYLHAVVEETLRIYTPVPAALPRVVPPGGASICGHWIPGGVTVGVPHLAAYRSTQNFADPLSFRPERWLSQRPAEFENDKQEVFQPFHTGPRNCLGIALAYAEMKLILARLLFQFDFELVDKQIKWDEQTSFVLYQKLPLLLHVRSRA